MHIACLNICTARDLPSFFGNLGGGGGEPMTQPSPAKPTWAQILNSNPNAPSNTASSSTTTANNNNNNSAAAAAVAGNNSPSSSSPSSQHSATTKNISPSAGGTSNIAGARPGFMSNFYEQQQQQQQQQQQSQMNWPLNFNQTPSWMMNDDDSQRQPTNSSQQSMDNNQMGGGDGRNAFLLRFSCSKDRFCPLDRTFFISFQALIDMNHRVQHLIGISR